MKDLLFCLFFILQGFHSRNNQFFINMLIRTMQCSLVHLVTQSCIESFSQLHQFSFVDKRICFVDWLKMHLRNDAPATSLIWAQNPVQCLNLIICTKILSLTIAIICRSTNMDNWNTFSKGCALVHRAQQSKYTINYVIRLSTKAITTL